MFSLKTKNLTETVTLKNLPTLRQTFVIGSLIIILGYVLGELVNPIFSFLPLFVAFGLMLAGLTSICPMVLFLQKMPWNK